MPIPVKSITPKVKFISAFVYGVVRGIAGTLHLRVINEDIMTAFAKDGKGCIIVTWHGRTLVPAVYLRGRGYWAFISTSRDGDYQDRIFRRLGWQTVRGSTSARGAVQSALVMVKRLKAGETLAHTPDGPRGPRGQVHEGAIFLAQKSGCPIIPAGISAAPRRFLTTWDKYLVPTLFGRAAIIFGAPLYIPASLSPDEQSQWAERIRTAIDALEQEAERVVGASVSTQDKDAQDVTECRPA